MARKIAVILAAIIIPGGFIALFGAFLVRMASQTERGRKVVDFARVRVPAFAGQLRSGVAPQRQVA